ncbi:MAG TPA: hypothetical protein PLX89_10770 [Verrucomicrobiota bacterium]|nr:hypothetical protein [Verrucomicrobiales bacterium]HRI13479.1 hypothetical protein [Verrucomicrobiota bacterium]
MSDPKVTSKRRAVPEGLGFGALVFLPLTAACVFAFGWSTGGGAADDRWLAVIVFLGPLLLPPALYWGRSRDSFAAVAGVLIPLEVLAALLAQYTIIGAGALFPLLLVWANLIPVGLRLSKREEGASVSWVLLGLIAMLVLPLQARLGFQLLRLQDEVRRIVAYSYDYKLRSGTFPLNLRDYPWTYPELRSHFSYHGSGTADKFTYPFTDNPSFDRSDKFSVRYYVGDPSTAYWYSSAKGWFVEDD